MNAVTTAEYAVLESMKPGELQKLINEHAAQGFKLIHYCATDYDGLDFTAVMVREPVDSLAEEWQAHMAEWEEAFKKYTQRVSAAFDPEKHFEQITMLQHSVEALQRAKEIHIDLITRLESRVTELERKVLYPSTGTK